MALNAMNEAYDLMMEKSKKSTIMLAIHGIWCIVCPVTEFSTNHTSKGVFTMKHYFYHVADCEHDGDMRHAEDEVLEAGGTVVNSYWDGDDCGEAYIEFTIPNGNEEKVLKALHLYHK